MAKKKKPTNVIWTTDEIAKTDFLVFRESSTKKITNVIAPNGLQIGLFDKDYVANLNVTGTITGSGEIYTLSSVTAKTGFTGSLQKTFAGANFLQGGSNVTVTNNDNGSITIASSAGALNNLTTGDGLQLDSGSTYNGAAARTISLDIKSSSGLKIDSTELAIEPSDFAGAGLADDGSDNLKVDIANQTNVTAATGDYVLIADADDSYNLKRTTVASIQSVSSFDIAALGSSLTESTLASGDLLAVADINDSNTVKKITAEDLGQYLASGTNAGVGESSGKLTIDLNDLSDVAIAVASDSFAFIDAGDNTTKKESIVDLVTAIRGTTTATGLASTSGVLNIDITNQSTLTLASNDELLVWDTDASALKKTTISDVQSSNLSLNSLSAATVSVANDSFAFIDADDSNNSKKESIADLVSLLAGDGLAASSGVLSLHLGELTEASVSVSNDYIPIIDGGASGTSRKESITDLVSAIASTGISTSSGQMSINFGSSAGQVAQGSNTVTVSAGDGLSGGGSAAIGGNVNLTIDINPEDFAGKGIIASSDDLHAYIQGGSNVTITTGSENQFVIAATNTNTTYSAGTGLDLLSTTFSIDDSVVATLTGSVFSGTVSGSLLKSNYISGSLTRLSDGSSYLIAGDNITITSGSNGAVTITSSGGGTSLTTVSGSTSVSDVSSINFDNLGLVQNLGSNQIAITGSIGPAEEGTYSDGLFTDFNSTTTVGTAVDRFNEVLKGLAPAAAPGLDDATCVDSGTSAKLSFGSSQSISGYTNAIASGLTPTDNLSDININGTYSSTVTSNDVRRACFAGATVINGTLNDDISVDGVNYAADSFGNGNQGTLKLYVNDNSTQIHSVDLSSFGSGNSLNGDSSGFNLSASTPGHFADSSNFDTFQHRQGTYIVTAASQRNGWNYARVTHTVGSTVTTTNYIEWVNDPDSNALAQAGSAMDTLVMTGTKNLSGVKYHTAGTAKYRIRVTNAYRNVYSTSNITFSETNCSIPDQSFPSINHAGGEDKTKVLHLTGSATITGDPILNGSISATTTVPHPLKSNLSGVGSQSISGILLYDLSDTSSVVSETFKGESYRLISGSFATQAHATGSAQSWDSTTSLSTVDGLLFYNSRLYAPSQGGASGDFRNTSDGGSITNGPSSNVNYSGITSGLRTFYRKFQNNSGGSKTNFDLTINGSGTIVSHGTTFSSSRIKVFVKLPTTDSSFVTGFMDPAVAFATGQVDDADGCLVGSLDSILNATNEVTFGTQSVGANEYIIVIIKADASFTGYISSMSTSWS